MSFTGGFSTGRLIFKWPYHRAMVSLEQSHFPGQKVVKLIWRPAPRTHDSSFSTHCFGCLFSCACFPLQHNELFLISLQNDVSTSTNQDMLEFSHDGKHAVHTCRTPWPYQIWSGAVRCLRFDLDHWFGTQTIGNLPQKQSINVRQAT